MRYIWTLLLISTIAQAETMHLEIQGETQNYTLSLEHQTSANSKLAITVHGYMNNCRYMDVINQALLTRNYDVLCMNLPGHGKSSGKPFDIDRFETYKHAIQAVIEKFQDQYEELIFVAHSTGTVGLTEMMLENESLPFKKIIFFAPLIRSYLYKTSYWAWRLGGRRLSKLPVRPIRDVHPEYQAIVNSDPYYPSHVPTHFAGQLFEWNERLIKKNRVSQQEIYIFFGTKDTVIDTDYNRGFYSKYFPNAVIKTIKDSSHLFYHHNDQIRRESLKELFKIID